MKKYFKCVIFVICSIFLIIFNLVPTIFFISLENIFSLLAIPWFILSFSFFMFLNDNEYFLYNIVP